MTSEAVTLEAATRVLAVSAAPATPPPLRNAAGLMPAASTFPIPGGTAWIRVEHRADGPHRCLAEGTSQRAATMLCLQADPSDVSTSGRLAERLLSPDGASGLPAPSAAVAVDGGGLVAATDHLGLHHIYGIQGSGWAAVSTSPSLLGRIAGSALDREALGAQALIGHHLGCDTSLRAVVKLPASGRWHLANGVLSLSCPTQRPEEEFGLEARDAVAAAAALLRTTLDRHLDLHPDLVLELSGGLDSRLLLAAVRPSRRAGLCAITARSALSRDDEVAEAIARRYRVQRQVVDIGGLGLLTPEEAHQLVATSACRHGGVGNPLELGVLAWMENRFPQRPRVNGQGGEYARGFYYAGQVDRSAVTAALVRRLARWRLFVNDRVDHAALDTDFAADAYRSTIERLEKIFGGYGTSWLRSCDEFYLRERMHRWVGVDVTLSGTERVILSPYFEPGFLAIARGLDPRLKRGSQFSARVLEHLDPELAAMPLDSGTRPDQLARPGAAGTMRTASSTTKKLAKRVISRVSGRGRQPIGAAALAALVAHHWRAHPYLLESVGDSGLLRRGWLDKFFAGTVDMTPPTVAFVANLEYLTPISRHG